MFLLFHFQLIKYIFKKNGSTALTGNFNLNNNKIINLKKASLNSDAVNLQQLNEANSVLETTVSKLCLKKDGTTLLTGNINLNNHKVVNMAIPTDKNDSVNKLYVDQNLTRVISAHMKIVKMYSNT